jgi:uncharacterized protein with ParB-like and HNH nuclease domain
MENMSEPTEFVLKSVNRLFKHRFFVPAYQRGYRWTETQVKQLLNDIWQFSKRVNCSEAKGEFYCLQPVVVARNGDKWEVIDGQQRITTIYLILKHLEEIIRMAFPNFSFQPPVYETRTDSEDFLENVKLKTEEEANQNVDYWHIWKAYNTIKEWFKDKNNNINAIDFLNTLLKYQPEDIEEGSEEESFDVANNVRVIWYEVKGGKTNNNYDIFTRLNIGKIPLTNAELVKALLLQKANFEENKATLKQIQIATEWDMIEKSLQEDAFWYFIYNPSNSLKYDNRIEFILDLMKGRTVESEFYHTYNEFQKEFSYDEKGKNKKQDIDDIWLSIKRYFMTLEEWYKDHTLFHYVGYLVECGKPINEIKEAKEGNKEKGILPKSRSEFIEYLKKEIRENFVNCNIDELNYVENKDRNKIRKILLLFNIQTILDSHNTDMRFPFHKYKLEDWDIEHVRSQNDQNDTGRIKNQDEWVDDILYFFVNSADKEEVEKVLTNSDTLVDDIKDICSSLLDCKEETDRNKKQIIFDNTYKKVSEYFKESKVPENINSISNLALLDSTTNRSYGNAFFPIKRKRIIENDKKGIFVPICTKNLFLKYYSKKLGEVMFWSEDDAVGYLDAIKEILSEFLTKETKLESTEA